MAFDLAAAIKSTKGKLKTVTTRVTRSDGTEIEENRAADGTFREVEDPATSTFDNQDEPVISNRRRKAVERARRFGYVLDLKPDLQVARVCEGVFLSSQDVVNNLELLRANGITHIVNAGVGISNVFPKQISYLNVEVLDLPDSNIREKFAEVHEFMRAAIEKGGNVLLHCNAGVSRSATLAISYVMRFHGVSFVDALWEVRSVRPAVRPNEGFHRQLEEYERELRPL